MLPTGRPHTITWEPTSSVGFNRMGFIATSGNTLAHSACITCALPISRPSAVTNELFAMFCDLNGATL